MHEKIDNSYVVDSIRKFFDLRLKTDLKKNIFYRRISIKKGASPRYTVMDQLCVREIPSMVEMQVKNKTY